jgi:mannose-6-phosphate isomerase-like protein (cupin superfamily)
MNCKVSPEEAMKQLLEQSEFPFTVVMKNGNMTVEYFSPQEIDEQTPHTQDELYVIIKGHATLCRDGKRISCKKADIIFVPAGMNHWFENFSDDFATWVIFYGPRGGERP